MKRLLGLAGMVIIGLAAALIAQASPGDVLYVGAKQLPIILTSGQRTALRNTLNTIWVGFTASNVDNFECAKVPQAVGGQLMMQNHCYLYEEVALSDSEFADLDLAGQIEDGTVDRTKIVKTRSPVILTPAQEVTMSALTQSVLGKPLDEVWSMKFFRDTLGNNTRIVCEHNPIVTASPSAYRTARRGGSALKPIGRVQ